LIVKPESRAKLEPNKTARLSKTPLGEIMISNFKVADPSPLIANKLLELISNQLFVSNLMTKASEIGDNGLIREQIIKLETLIESQRRELGM
jgi:hypothetical protein